MNELSKVFNYENRQVRTITKDGEPWFVAKDVCEILELEQATKALYGLDEDEVTKSKVIDSLGREQEVNVINEPGLYSLVLKSRKPEAKSFKRWVTHEVIPSIRKHGMYATEELLDNPDFLIQTIQTLKEERNKRKQLELENAQKQQIICELQPKATYYDLVLQNKSIIPISHIAKDYGMSAMKFNALLHELHVQYKLQDTWLLYADHQSEGYTQSKTHVIDADRSKIHTYWTQKGRLFLYDLLKNEKGILPLIERQVITLVSSN